MSSAKQKSFVIKHVFKDVGNMEQHKFYYGKRVNHCGLSWSIYIHHDGRVGVYFECQKTDQSKEWSVEVNVEGSCSKKTGSDDLISFNQTFSKKLKARYVKYISFEDFLVDGSLKVWLEVKINKTTGIKLPDLIARNFSDERAKQFSDVVLVVGDQKFYVNKMYLALHSTYFESLFLGKFQESGKPEVELKDIDVKAFQSFLELLYGELAVDDETVENILNLADFFNSELAIRRCEFYLLEKSELSLKVKFHAAIRYKLNNLKKKCLSEMKTSSDFLSIVPEDPTAFDPTVWKELFVTSHSSSK